MLNVGNTSNSDVRDGKSQPIPTHLAGQDRVPSAEKVPAAAATTSYGSTSIGGRARAVVGDVSHTHYHYHEGHQFPRTADGRFMSDRAHQRSSLQLSKTSAQVHPDAISPYDQRFQEVAIWSGTPVLICTGSVGCGKSILASAVIDHLELQSNQQPSSVVSYFVDANQNQPATEDDVVRALIKQLLQLLGQRNISPSKELDEKVQLAYSTATKPAPATSAQLLCSLLALIPTCYVVLDGIDAMEEQNVLGLFRVLRDVFDEKQTPKLGCKLIMFCRDTLGRGIRVESIPCSKVFPIHLAHIQHDLYAYVDHQVHTHQQERSITSDLELLQEVKDVLKANSRKMFLWVQLQVKSIWDPDLSTRPEVIRAQLSALPEGLDDIYIQCLNRIESNNHRRSRDVAPRVFKWVACASRPLAPQEIQELVSMNPESLPLTKDMLLGIPVVDYCANLVVHNPLTGYIEFAHPTVKDLLQSDLQGALRHYRLDFDQDNLWCADLCLSYATYQRARTQVVEVKKQHFDTKRVSHSIFRTVSETLAPRRRGWPLSNRQLVQGSARKDVQVSLVSPQVRQIRSDLAAHGYMCKNWLHHTTKITPTYSKYEDFVELCLCHDNTFQPWAETQAKNEAHWERLVAYSAMTNHVPLLHVAVAHFRRHKRLLNIFHRPCPGTGASYLHVSSALGNTEITEALLEVCPLDIADSDGRSALAVAAVHHHNTIVQMVLESPKFRPASLQRQLKDFEGNVANNENILIVCAVVGNLAAVRLLWDVPMYRIEPEDFITEATFQACRYGQKEVAWYLVSQGASPDFYWPASSAKAGGNRKIASSLQQAVSEGDVSLMEMLLEVGADPHSTTVKHPDVIDVVRHCTSERKLHQAGNFVAALCQYGACVWDGLRDEEPSWLDQVVSNMVACRPRSRRYWTNLLRVIIDLSVFHFEFAQSLKHHLPALYSGRTPHRSESHEQFQTRLGLELAIWVQLLPDDLLLRVLRFSWIDPKFLYSPGGLRALARRGTSRGLEEALSLSEIGYTRERLFWKFGDLQPYEDIDLGRAPPDPFNDLTPTHAIFASDSAWKSEAFLLADDSPAESPDQTLRSLFANSNFGPLSQLIFDELINEGKDPSVGLVAYYSPSAQAQLGALERVCRRSDSNPLFVGILQRYGSIIEVLQFCQKRNVEFATLPWLRAYTHIKGHDLVARASAAEKLCRLMYQVRSDVNFALNYPAGYTHNRSWLCIHKSILLGLYAWNYHLRRRRSKPYSKADTWYVGLKMIECYLEDHPKVREHFVPTLPEPLEYGAAYEAEDTSSLFWTRKRSTGDIFHEDVERTRAFAGIDYRTVWIPEWARLDKLESEVDADHEYFVYCTALRTAGKRSVAGPSGGGSTGS